MTRKSLHERGRIHGLVGCDVAGLTRADTLGGYSVVITEPFIEET
jgi:hypothetical protein